MLSVIFHKGCGGVVELVNKRHYLCTSCGLRILPKGAGEHLETRQFNVPELMKQEERNWEEEC